MFRLRRRCDLTRGATVAGGHRDRGGRLAPSLRKFQNSLPPSETK